MTVSTAPCRLLICDLAHAVADHFAAAELHLLAIDGEILLHLDDEIGVGEPHAIAGGRPEHVGIDFTRSWPASSGSFRRQIVAETRVSASQRQGLTGLRRASMPSREKSRKPYSSSGTLRERVRSRMFPLACTARGVNFCTRSGGSSPVRRGTALNHRDQFGELPRSASWRRRLPKRS